MPNYKITEQDQNILVTNLKDFSLPEILDCGQCFRWQPDENNIWNGVAFGKKLSIKQISENEFLFIGTNLEDFKNIWINYFDLDTDYNKIKNIISSDKIMSEAVKYAPGIRILRQESWETLCTFIISQNNNIKRIRGITEKLCKEFGEEVDGIYTFPTAERLAKLTLEELEPLKSGFRAKYILDAAQKVSDGTVNLDEISKMSYEDAKNYLRQIKGVGPKVADCTLLFGFYRLEAFPEDVWIKRAMKTFYPEGLPENLLEYRGIAQQYLFHYARTKEDSLENVK